MIKAITKSLGDEEWYQSLIEDCQGILTEGIWNYRWTLIKTYHLFGNRILEDYENFKKVGITKEKDIRSHVTKDLKQSDRTIRRAIQFSRYVKKELKGDLDNLPGGKNISWHKICNELLPESKEKDIPLPEGKYQVILADPPWPYPKRQDAKNLYGNTDYHYETMKIQELCEMKVGELANDNSVLFIWVATNFLEDSFEVIKSWGFEYKSQMAWVKEGGKQGGIGWYFWGDHELLLVATKGSMLPEEKFSSVLKAPRQEHSQKPKEVYEIIEKMYPGTKRIELFARGKPHKGWVAWGDQVNEN